MLVRGQLKEAQIEFVDTLPTAVYGRVVFLTTDDTVYWSDGTNWFAIVGALASQSLENKTIDGDLNTITNLFHGQEVDDPTTGVHGVTGDVVGTSDSQTLTNKTLDGAIVANGLTTASDANLLLDPHGTGSVELGAKLVGANNTNIDIEAQGAGGVVLKGAYTNAADFSAMAGADNTKLISFDPSGQDPLTTTTLAGTATDLRTIMLPNADTTLVGHNTTNTLTNKTFDDAVTLKDIASPTQPNSGYGKIYFKGDKLYQMNDGGTESEVGSGSGGGGINYVTNGEFETNADGWAAVGTITITRSASSPLRGAASGVITNGANNDYIKYPFTIADADKAKVLRISFDINTGALADNELQVSIYDATNLVTIPVVDGNIKAGVGRYIGEFQTASNSNSYELRITQIAETSGWTTAKVDNVQVGPREISRGSVVTDWVSYTPTGAMTNMTYAGRWRRVGDSMEVEARATATGTPTGSFTISVPSGYTIDSTKVNNPQHVGSGHVDDYGVGVHLVAVLYIGSSTSVSAYGDDGAGGVTATSPITFGTNDNIKIRFSVPITGWSSNTTISTDFGGRVISFAGTQSSEAVTANTTNIAFTAAKDSVSGWSGTTYTVKESGDYVVDVSGISNTAGTSFSVYKNTVLQNYTASAYTSGAAGGGTMLVPNLVVGDVLSIRSSQSATITYGRLGIHKIQSPQTLMGGEVVAARYNRSTAQSSISSGTTDLIFDNKLQDTHNAYNVSNGVYTVPETGFYTVGGMANQGSVSPGGFIRLSVYVGASESNCLCEFRDNANDTFQKVGGSTLMHLTKGQQVTLRLGWDAGGTKSTVASESQFHYFFIKKEN